MVAWKKPPPPAGWKVCCWKEYLRRLGCLVFEKFLFGFFFLADFRVLLADFRVLRPVGFSYCLGDRRDRPCRDPLKRDSGRYTITLIRDTSKKMLAPKSLI